MAKIEDTIATLEAKLKQAKALKQKQEAQKKAQEKKLTRTQDTRRKILVGSLFLERASSSDAAQAELKALLNPFLTRSDDRALFDLPTLSSYEENKQKIREFQKEFKEIASKALDEKTTSSENISKPENSLEEL